MYTDNDEANLSSLQQQAIEWLVRLRTHELTETESQEFADWLSRDLSHAHAEDLFDVMTQSVQLKTAGAKSNPIGIRELAVTDVISTSGKRSPLRWLAVPLVLAAAWLFAVTLVLPEQAQPVGRLPQ